MKTCFKCRRCLRAVEFYRHSMMSDGRLNKCKDCTREDARKHRADNLDKCRAYDRARGKTAARKSQYREKNRAKRKAMGPLYTAAHNAVTRAVRSVRLKNPRKCSKCPSRNHISAHRDDYTKPLAIKWLCPICHAARHKQLGRLRTMATMYGEQPDPF